MAFYPYEKSDSENAPVCFMPGIAFLVCQLSRELEKSLKAFVLIFAKSFLQTPEKCVVKEKNKNNNNTNDDGATAN